MMEKNELIRRIFNGRSGRLALALALTSVPLCAFLRPEDAVRATARPIAMPRLGLPPFLQRFNEDISPRAERLAVAKSPAFTEVLAEHTLTFRTRGEDERANILLAAESINGVIVPPGAEFSFNAVVGERTEERGFRPGLMYFAGRLVSGVGGGVCIPSTALYHVSLLADMEIVERHHHSGPVSYAEPGLDAAVVFGLKDLRFRNRLPVPVMLAATVEGDALTVALRGASPSNRRVELERVGLERLTAEDEVITAPEAPEGEPVVDQAGRTGYRVTVVRRVYEGERLIRTETISHDTVLPIARVLRANPVDIAKPGGESSEPALVAVPALEAIAAPADATPRGETEQPAASPAPAPEMPPTAPAKAAPEARSPANEAERPSAPATSEAHAAGQTPPEAPPDDA